MQKKELTIESQARYFTRIDENVEIKYVWLVAHGYGQLAEYFIRHFYTLPSEHAILAPEGSHRFYLKGSSGRVGASWMTKLEREQDIEYYQRLLDAVMHQENQWPDAKIIAFGFSQGAATIGRWLCNTELTPEYLILWAGAWPHDMSIDHNYELMSRLRIFIVVGRQDQYLGEQGISRYLEAFDNNNVKYELIQFDGDHSMDQETLLQLSTRITG
ncbi:MAG: putative esterase [Patiriisocius sp.]|jgi:predicted esterase